MEKSFIITYKADTFKYMHYYYALHGGILDNANI